MNKTHDPKWKASYDKRQAKERGKAGKKHESNMLAKAHMPMGREHDRKGAPGHGPKPPMKPVESTSHHGEGSSDHEQMLRHGHVKLSGGLLAEMCKPQKLPNVMGEDENEGEAVRKSYDGYHGHSDE